MSHRKYVKHNAVVIDFVLLRHPMCFSLADKKASDLLERI